LNPKKDEQKATSAKNNASATYNTTMPNQAVVSKSKKEEPENSEAPRARAQRHLSPRLRRNQGAIKLTDGKVTYPS
jgi:hypothetical protein